MGAWFSHVGELHTVFHIWEYPSLEEREKTRAAAWQVEVCLCTAHRRARTRHPPAPGTDDEPRDLYAYRKHHKHVPVALPLKKMTRLQVVCTQLIDAVKILGGQRRVPERKGLREPVLARVRERVDVFTVLPLKLRLIGVYIRHR